MRKSSRSVPEWRRLMLETHGDLLAGGPEVCWSVELIGSLLADLGAQSVLVVVDHAAIAASGLGREIFRQIAGCGHEQFREFEPNPSWQSGAAAARLGARLDADAVLAVGGGSCCDVAKVAALGARCPRLIDDLAKGGAMPDARPLPVIAVPTTSGTGSEATHFAAIFVGDRKVSVAHPGLLPAYAVLDDRLHLPMPKALAAATAMDAICQAMESVWAVAATPESHRLAIAAGEMAAANAAASVVRADVSARRAMMFASHLSGRAINISKTTAAHALSYQLTRRYGLAHGHAVALTIGQLAASMIEADPADCVHPEGAAVARDRVFTAAALLGVTPSQLPERIRDMLRAFGLPEDLRAAGVPREAIPEFAEAADPVRLGNHPFRMGTQQLAEVLSAAWSPGVLAGPGDLAAPGA